MIVKSLHEQGVSRASREGTPQGTPSRAGYVTRLRHEAMSPRPCHQGHVTGVCQTGISQGMSGRIGRHRKTTKTAPVHCPPKGTKKGDPTTKSPSSRLRVALPSHSTLWPFVRILLFGSRLSGIIITIISIKMMIINNDNANKNNNNNNNNNDGERWAPEWPPTGG